MNHQALLVSTDSLEQETTVMREEEEGATTPGRLTGFEYLLLVQGQVERGYYVFWADVVLTSDLLEHFRGIFHHLNISVNIFLTALNYLAAVEKVIIFDKFSCAVTAC